MSVLRHFGRNETSNLTTVIGYVQARYVPNCLWSRRRDMRHSSLRVARAAVNACAKRSLALCETCDQME